MGIQFFENGNFKMQSSEPTQFTEAKFLRSSELFAVGYNKKIETVPQALNMANLFVLKRYVLPEEARSFVYDGTVDLYFCTLHYIIIQLILLMGLFN